MALDLSKFINRFVDEAREHLGSLEQGLAQLEANPGDKELINGLFRSAHTIKGGSRMLKLGSITETAHALEDVLGLMRDGQARLDGRLAGLLQQGLDGLSRMVDLVAAKEPLPEADQGLIAALAQATSTQGLPPEITGAQSAAPAQPTVGAQFIAPDQPQTSAEGVGQQSTAPDRTTAGTQSVGAQFIAPTQPQPATTEASIKLQTAESVRVRLDRLDALIKLMGELIANSSRLEHGLIELEGVEQALGLQSRDQVALVPLVQALNKNRSLWMDVFANQERLMQDLSTQALGLRMLPLGAILDDSARQVRELGRSLGKEVRCQITGSEIELDRQMITQLADPLVHILRNAVDHGLERPEERQAAGKPPQGRVDIRASQEGASVLLEIRDDGAGLPVEKIRAKALAKELITPEQAEHLTEEQILDLIFLPGFSTSAIITDISGRGVGMDVVRQTVVHKLHGSVSVQSQPGLGTNFQIRLPMTLALMRVLLCEVDGLLVGFAAQHVHEIRRVKRASRLDIAGRAAFVHHNEFVPLARLSSLLGLPEASEPKETPQGDLVVVVRGRTSKLGLWIDQLRDERDLVISPMPEYLRGLPLVNSMLAFDNRLVSLLQPQGLVEMARVQRGEALVQPHTEGKASARVWQVLVVDDSINTREIEKEVLEAHGFVVGLAKDGADGLRKAQQQQFDAVLTDVEMPIMDGFTLTEKLRELPAYAGIPIIIVTSREKDEDKRRGIRAGADAYIVKGDFDQSNLVDTLHNLLV